MRPGIEAMLILDSVVDWAGSFAELFKKGRFRTAIHVGLNSTIGTMVQRRSYRLINSKP